MQLKYDKDAFDKNIFIVGSCGFDSVPADMGLIFTKNNFKRKYILIYCDHIIAFNIGIHYFLTQDDLNHVESYLSVKGNENTVYFSLLFHFYLNL
jgi:hypothetical protein